MMSTTLAWVITLDMAFQSLAAMKIKELVTFPPNVDSGADRRPSDWLTEQMRAKPSFVLKF